VLERSKTEHGPTWLHELLLGVAKLDKGDSEAARQHFEASRRLRDNYLACRHLALLAQQAGDLDAATDLYLEAWEQSGQSVYLAVEICRFFQNGRMLPELETFLSQLPEGIVRHERIQLAVGQLALEMDQFDKLREILTGDFCTIREGETLLTDLWFALHIKEAEARKGAVLTEKEQADAMAQHPPPYEIDFRMVNA
jgi:hypothetical protein